MVIEHSSEVPQVSRMDFDRRVFTIWTSFHVTLLYRSSRRAIENVHSSTGSLRRGIFRNDILAKFIVGSQLGSPWTILSITRERESRTNTSFFPVSLANPSTLSIRVSGCSMSTPMLLSSHTTDSLHTQHKLARGHVLPALLLIQDVRDEQRQRQRKSVNHKIHTCASSNRSHQAPIYLVSRLPVRLDDYEECPSQ